MTLGQIKQAVNAGKTVHWVNPGYIVTVDSLGQWFILYIHNNDCIGLTYLAGATLNGKPEQFFTA